MNRNRWTHTWVSMPQPTEPPDLPPAPFTVDGSDGGSVLVDTTLRQTVRASVGGGHLRLRFSNAFGAAALPITAVTVALPRDGRAGVSAILPQSRRPVTFAGRSRVVVPVGAQVVSDPLAFRVTPRSTLTVTAYLAEGLASHAVTSHAGARTTSYLSAGDHVAEADLPGATAVDHWYLLSGVEVWAQRGTRAAVLLGDSLTDGRGTTTNGNDRWPDRLVDRLHARRATAGVALLNQAGGGNRVLADGLGPSILARLDRDVLALGGVRWLVVFAGVNDLGAAEATDAACGQVAADLIAAYDQLVVRAHAHGIRVYGATLTPFGGHGYDDDAGFRERARQAVNDWIRTAGRFDDVFDFDLAVRDPAHPRRLRAALHDGDHLHLNPTGYQVLADAVPLRAFRRWPRPPDPRASDGPATTGPRTRRSR